MSEVVLKVDGMSCGHCVNSVEKALQSIGAEGTVDLASKKVTVKFDEAKVNTKAIVEAIEDQGYDVVQ
ncbi:copper ion binding protein [Paenibacillus endoradicis]|uniref:copper ion binding protein n=1 Tax=Paenibacillus endoradicis TaxID=2972487 RepID=UPI0021596C5C|nr:copper ion binding protein [Paenibacillus endoradicis]MCR8657043.1 copper ion binding protein [Paenibacillus endoradicis]